MKLRVVPSAFSLILSGGIPGLIAVTPAPAAAAKSALTMTDLGNLGGGVSIGFGINASGEVVGRSFLDKVCFFKCGKHTCRFTQNDPFSWTAGTMTDLGTFSATAMTDLGTLDSTQNAAYAINDNGQVTDWARTAGEATHLFMWSNGTITDLGTFGLDPVGEAINNHGVIVGQSSLGAWIWSGGVSRTATKHAFLLTQLVSAPRTYRPPDSRRTERPAAGSPDCSPI